MISAWDGVQAIKDIEVQIDQLNDSIAVLADDSGERHFTAFTFLNAAKAAAQDRMTFLVDRLKATSIEIEEPALKQQPVPPAAPQTPPAPPAPGPSKNILAAARKAARQRIEQQISE